MKTIKISLLAMGMIFFVSCEKQTENKENFAENTTTDVSLQETSPLEQADNQKVLADNTMNSADAPVLKLEQASYDFGNVDANSKTEKIIEFTNTGNSPLMIKSAKASCGCTVPEYSKEPIAPGETGSLKVSYKAPGTNGKQTKTVTLTTNTEKGRETFKIVANVVGGKERQAPKPQPQSAPLPAPKLGQ